MRASYFPLFLFALLSSQAPASTPHIPPPYRVTGAEFDGVIISAEECLASDPQHIVKSSEVWTPSEADVREAEARLPSYISSRQAAGLPKHSRIRTQLRQYKRQYWGAIRGRHREILILFYHADTDVVRKGIWSRGIMAVAGGGEYFFQVRFRLDNKMFYGLQVNAPL
jgi:hypothetical protein